jgi:hypothetical protein
VILAFIALQALDFATTAIYRHMGGTEANPVDAVLMQTFGTLGGLCIAKVFTLMLFGLLVECAASKRPVRIEKRNAAIEKAEGRP